MEKVLKTMRSNIKKIIDGFGLSDLTFAEINYLLFIGEQTKSMKEIVIDMVVAYSTPTRIIDTLVAKGLVERYADNDDRRKVIVRLTDTGIKLYIQINNKRNEQIENAFKNLSDDEKKSFLNTINIIIDNIENY